MSGRQLRSLRLHITYDPAEALILKPVDPQVLRITINGQPMLGNLQDSVEVFDDLAQW